MSDSGPNEFHLHFNLPSAGGSWEEKREVLRSFLVQLAIVFGGDQTSSAALKIGERIESLGSEDELVRFMERFDDLITEAFELAAQPLEPALPSA